MARSGGGGCRCGGSAADGAVRRRWPCRGWRSSTPSGPATCCTGAFLAGLARDGTDGLPALLEASVAVASNAVAVRGAARVGRGRAMSPGRGRDRRRVLVMAATVERVPFDGFDGDVRARLEAMRASVRATAPDAVESMAYGMPAYKLDRKPLVYFAGFPMRVGSCATPNGHEAFAEDFARYVQGKGSVQFPHSEPPPLGVVRRVAEFRVAAIRGSGPRPPRGRSAHPGGAELDGDPRAHRLAGLGHAVVPGALAGAAHDDEVAVPGGHLIDGPPPRGRSTRSRGAPTDRMATMVSWSRERPMRSPCQATESCPSR